MNMRHVRFCTGGHGGERAARRPHPTPPHRPTTYRPNGHPTSVTHPTPPPSKQPAGQNVIYMVPLHNDSYPLNTYIQHHAQAGKYTHTSCTAFLVPDSPILTTDQNQNPPRNEPTTTNHNQPQPTNQPKKAPLTHMKVSLSACRSPHKCRWMVCQNGQKM